MVWLGHAGFRFSVYDDEKEEHVFYIDPWFSNPKCPELEKKP
jgi:L-ascorbate metabolism protein UlaG (beta-lactamase superfamily)